MASFAASASARFEFIEDAIAVEKQTHPVDTQAIQSEPAGPFCAVQIQSTGKSDLTNNLATLGIHDLSVVSLPQLRHSPPMYWVKGMLRDGLSVIASTICKSHSY